LAHRKLGNDNVIIPIRSKWHIESFKDYVLPF
jgi:hypothetical protein